MGNDESRHLQGPRLQKNQEEALAHSDENLVGCGYKHNIVFTQVIGNEVIIVFNKVRVGQL